MLQEGPHGGDVVGTIVELQMVRSIFPVLHHGLDLVGKLGKPLNFAVELLLGQQVFLPEGIDQHHLVLIQDLLHDRHVLYCLRLELLLRWLEWRRVELLLLNLIGLLRLLHRLYK
jgi:hypothetical protein